MIIFDKHTLSQGCHGQEIEPYLRHKLMHGREDSQDQDRGGARCLLYIHHLLQNIAHKLLFSLVEGLNIKGSA